MTGYDSFVATDGNGLTKYYVNHVRSVWVPNSRPYIEGMDGGD